MESEMPPANVKWGSLVGQSLLFLGVEHGFRLATEEGTRQGMRGKFWQGYASSVGNLHGWSDKDPAYVNYLGHPLQGSVAGYIWANNDPRYEDVIFGSDKRYWKSRLRATAFSFVYSTQFEIGPLSEATIGKIQSRHPQEGLVDHVVTPVIGMGWMVAEDMIDRYVITWFEDRVENPYLRMLVRGLNPSRSMANLMAFKVPWYRTNRPGAHRYRKGMSYYRGRIEDDVPIERKEPVFQLQTPFEYWRFGSIECIGGSAAGIFRVSTSWDFVTHVSGCKVLGLEDGWNGNSLQYMVGPRWTHRTGGRWNPHTEFLIGGQRVVHERVNYQLREWLLSNSSPRDNPQRLYEQYARRVDAHGLALLAGAGVDVKLNEALALRVAKVDYQRSWIGAPQRDLNQGIRFSTGFILRMGTW